MRQIKCSRSQGRIWSPPGGWTPFAWWLAVLAIVLHTAAPFFGSSQHVKAPRPQAHDHGSHERGALNTAAPHAPNAPGEICIGDCPISVGSNSPLMPSESPAASLPPAVVIMVRAVAVSLPRAFDHALFRPPRAPPVLT